MFGGTEGEEQTTVSLFWRGKEKCFFAISKEKTRQRRLFTKPPPLESPPKTKSKATYYQRGHLFSFCCTWFLFNAQKVANPPHLLYRRTISATTQWSAFLPPQAARGQSEAVIKAGFQRAASPLASFLYGNC